MTRPPNPETEPPNLADVQAALTALLPEHHPIPAGTQPPIDALTEAGREGRRRSAQLHDPYHQNAVTTGFIIWTLRTTIDPATVTANTPRGKVHSWRAIDKLLDIPPRTAERWMELAQKREFDTEPRVDSWRP